MGDFWKTHEDDDGVFRAPVDEVREAIEGLRSALRAAQLHLMVRPHMRMPNAEENVKAAIRAALEGA